jgi:hypothetical protein
MSDTIECSTWIFIDTASEIEPCNLSMNRMALRKGKIVEAARVHRSACAGEKEEVLGIAFGDLEIPLCTLAPLPLEHSYAAYSSA